MTDNRFSQTLRMLRQRAGFQTIAEFAEYLKTVHLHYSIEAVGHWERGIRKPSRETLIAICRGLHHQGIFEQRQDIDELFGLLDYTGLNGDEIVQYFPDLKPIPLNIPPLPHVHDFIGRSSTIRSLMEIMANSNEPKVMAISGLGGIGKTALAREVALRTFKKGLFTDVLWTSAKTEEIIGARIHPRQAFTYQAHAILTAFANQLAIQSPPTQFDRLLQQIKALLSDQKILVVLDNLETVQDGDAVVQLLYELVASTSGCRVLLTTRERLTDKSYVYDYHLTGLDEADAISLLRTNAIQRNAHSMLENPALLKEAYKITGGMPLAIVLLVSQYLAGIALDEELERLKRATSEEELYRFIYFDLWVRLPEFAQILLISLGTIPTEALRLIVQMHTGLSDDDFLDAVTDLNRFSLMEIRQSPLANQQLYDVHSMTRWFVNSPLDDMWGRYNDNPTTL